MVELDKKYNLQNSGTGLDETLLRSLPLPVYDAYKLLENQSDYEKSLQVLCLSLIPWTCQYIALILSGEYLSSGHEPSFEVTDTLLNMIKKPGPGKWIGFIRVAARYFSDHSAIVISPEAISKLSKVLNSKEQPFVKISGNDNKLEYSDALINIRNRFAHGRLISGDKAKELFLDYFLIWKAWIVIIRDVFEARLLYRSTPTGLFQPFDNRPFDMNNLTPDIDKTSTILWDEKRKTYIRLYPVIVTYSETQKGRAEVAFLEEIRNRYLFYLRGEDFFKLKDEFQILSQMIESKTIVAEVVTAESLTLRTFAERIDRITSQTITGFQDTLKYIPEMYVDRPPVTNDLDTWIQSDLPGCIITGDPGTGKTSIITNWCIQRKTKGDHILLLEASGLKESDITMIIEKELNLASPLKECLDTIQKENKSSSAQEIKKFIIVIDAINEFTGKDNENRGRLWREINSLINILDLYKPFLKCLVTTRNDLWAFDFPGKNTAYDILKDKLFWGNAENGFPRIILGNLSQDEACEIFEKARKIMPTMAILNTFSELPEKTKMALCNPFLLRLALITYSEKLMPALTRSKIEKQYAKERITEEEDKKKVLFTLLERMSEIRKTEITIDELLYGEAKSKLSKVTNRDKKYLEKLVFDPRQKSPYKQLLREGIIEEKTDWSGIKSKEKIKFPQEKIIDIIYPEFLRRFYKRVNWAVTFMAVILVLYLGSIFFGSVANTKGQINDIRSAVSKEVHDPGKSAEIISLSSGITKRINYITDAADGLKMAIIYLLMIAATLFTPWGRSLGARIIKNDLPSRFLKEKYNLIKQKKFYIGLIPLFLIITLYFIMNDFDLSEKGIKYGIPLFLVYNVLWELILGAIIVYRNANSPLDAFCLFGKKEVIQSCINYSFVIPFIVLMFICVPLFIKMKNVSSDEKLIAFRQEWISNKSVVSLQSNSPGLYSDLSKKLIEAGNKPPKLTPEFTLYFKVFIYSVCISYALMLLLQYYIGSWLYNLLKRRL